MMNNKKIPQMLSAKDLANTFRCSVRTVQRWAKIGILPKGKKIGRLRRWLHGEIAGLLEKKSPARTN